ncbi:threonine--tRNA ligase [Rickettsiales bacterium LUAb2]
MLKITLIDNSIKEFKAPVTPLQIAESISPSLAKSCLYAIVNGIEYDLTRNIEEDSKLELITKKDEARALPVIRHDLAHILAEAVTELYENVKVATGPATESGFFYDFYTNHNFSTEDLAKIEQRMREIISRNEIITREVWTKQQALEYFTNKQEFLKIEIINAIPAGETLTVYKQGNFLDLCRGPHLKSTGVSSNAFKLTKVSSVYWKGDKNSHSLQRIYAIAFLNDQDLKSYEKMQEEALARDHRKLGKELELFHLQEEAVGSVFWHPKGWALYRAIEEYIREKLAEYDYVEVKTPQILSRSLWEKSGHWEKFHDDIFVIEGDKEELAVKPMNCPGHIQIFKQGLKSYKDLPIRTAEFGSCFRNEPSGALHGIMRVRAFTQDDAHIFCTEEQVVPEAKAFTKLLKEVYKDLLGEVEVIVKLSTRPEKRAGTDMVWDRAEQMLYDAAKASGLDVIMNPGEGAFYGPKLEFTLKDSIGRHWQVGTLQLDFVLPDRLEASYIGADGKQHTPILLHRAILGSFERFIGILLEHYAGKLPLWLSPIQVVIASITNDVDNYAKDLYNQLTKNKIRVNLDLRNEKISYKIREHSLNKVPFIVVLGKQEMENNTIVIRVLGSNEQKSLKSDELLSFLQEQIKQR